MTPETGNEKFAKRVDEFNKSDASLEMPKSDVRQELTYGQKAVGLTFNPGGSAEVNQIKRLCAAVIDELNSQREEAKMQNNGEKIAQFTLAIRDIQSGKMWGVNAATWQY